MRRVRLGLAVLMAGWPILARAAMAPAEVMHRETSYIVRADGTYTSETAMDIRANGVEAARSMAQIPLSYRPSLGTLSILEAYTLKPDGRRLEVGSAGIRDQASPNASVVGAFTDLQQ